MKKMFVLVWGVSLNLLVAQNQLDSLEIVSKQDFVVGHMSQPLSDSIFNRYSLSSILGEKTSIQPLENGRGMVSSFRYRGFSASQLAVLWEGIPINSILNGQTDFNAISSLSGTDIVLNSGGGSSLYGSNAMGGTLQITNNLNQIDTNTAKIGILGGSFGTFGGTLQSQGLISKKIPWMVHLGYRKSKNDYHYEVDNLEQKLANAEFNQLNINSSFMPIVKEKHQLKFSISYDTTDRNVPGSFAYPESYQSLDDEIVKSTLAYTFGNQRKNTFQLGYIAQEYGYTYDTRTDNPSISNAKSYIGLIERKEHWGRHHLQGGISVLYHEAEGENYTQEANRNEIHSFVSYLYHYNKLKTSLHLNQSFSNQYSFPFTFNWGVEYALHTNWTAKTSLSKNYKIPSLNDLFFTFGGNPDLKPEDAWVKELGIVYENTSHTLNWTSELQFFHNDVDNQIVWIPNEDFLYAPQNIDKVRHWGVELRHLIETQIAGNLFQFTVNYLYTHSQNKKTNKRLIYIPLHQINSSITYSIKPIHIQFRYRGVSNRSIDENETQFLDEYHVFDIGISTHQLWKKWNIQLDINNIFDRNYLTNANFPMPGMYFQLGLQYQVF